MRPMWSMLPSATTIESTAPAPAAMPAAIVGTLVGFARCRRAARGVR